MAKKIICTVAFLLIFAFIFTFLNSPVIWNPNIEFHAVAIDQMYAKENKNKFDVVFIGSSHANCTFYTKVFWEQHGIASHVFSSSSQELYVSEYFLKETLKVQSPKVVVVEIFGATIGVGYSELNSKGSLMTSYSMTPLSLEKIKLLYTALNDRPVSERFLPLFPLIAYHENWKVISLNEIMQLNPEKYKYNFGNQLRNSINNTLVEPLNYSEDIIDFDPYSKQSLLNIVDICKENNIELVFVASPFVIDEKTQAVFNNVEQIAQQENIQFINYNKLYQEIEIDFKNDFFDYQHLNIYGMEKVSTHFGEYLVENYDLPDRRGEERYSDYDLAEQMVQR